MVKISMFLTLLVLLSENASAQFSRYVVKLRDKQFNTFSINNPSQFLSQRAIDRRARYNIAIDSTDLPVTSRYLDSIRNAGVVTILNTSKWLNTVTIKTTDATALSKIQAFPFVESSTPIAPLISTGFTNDKFGTTEGVPFTEPEETNLTDYYDYGRSNGQVKIHKGDFLHNLGFRGEGMQLAMLDAGYFRYLSLPTFDSVRNNGQILETWDFVANEASVDEDHNHGMHCFSMIAANMPGLFVGTAPKCSFYLYRTEDVSSEYPVEEYNLAAGYERADSAGADVCNISLGYYQFDNASFNYTYADMNGNVSPSARATDLAAKKGMLMVTSAGNEGTNTWHFIITPADADSSLTVGAVDTLGNIANFSSYGPSSDGDVKPNVASVGLRSIVANTSTGTPIYGNGTSFAAPNLAGITTCLWQAFPEVNNMTIINALEVNAHLADAPQVQIGYGIPDAKAAFVHLLKLLAEAEVTVTPGCINYLSLHVKADSVMSITVERKLPNETSYSDIHTWEGTGAFTQKHFNLNDDVSGSAGGTTSYRFRMNISTDTTFYIDSAMVIQGSCIVTENDIKVNPNPVVTNMNVIISRLTAANYNIIVYNSAGQRVYFTSGRQSPGRANYQVSMAKMSRGVYIVSVWIDGKKVFAEEVLR